MDFNNEAHFKANIVVFKTIRKANIIILNNIGVHTFTAHFVHTLSVENNNLHTQAFYSNDGDIVHFGLKNRGNKADINFRPNACLDDSLFGLIGTEKGHKNAKDRTAIEDNVPNFQIGGETFILQARNKKDTIRNISTKAGTPKVDYKDKILRPQNTAGDFFVKKKAVIVV